MPGDKRKGKQKARQLTKEEEQNIKEAFEALDRDGSGSIDAKALGMVMAQLGLEVSREEVRRMMADIDVDGNGTIDYGEFRSLMTDKMSAKDSKKDILAAFNLFDDDHTGKISFKNLKRVANDLGETLTDEQLREMIQEADRDGDGEVSGIEFLDLMKRANMY
eukprot:comp9429_c0_seq1/m.4482 comp9429_c0_seq1/g.4482  ORF comp9429_c0_seq1/g.4482 comp9429_c0_seq1/m.4482 type:complete len:163 (-) comp9429_c0_seq1:325-813(-)